MNGLVRYDNFMKNFLIVFSAIVMLGSCQTDRDQFNWETEILAPIVKAELTVHDLVDDNTSVQVNNDKTVSIVFSEKIYSYSPDTLINISVDPFIQSFKINQLQLDDINVTERITMGELLTQLGVPAFNGLPIIINKPDSTIDVSFGPFEGDFSEIVQTATLSGGTAQITINNQFPLSMRDVIVEVRNKNSGDLIESIYFDRINAKSSATRTFDLTGKTIEGVLEMYVPTATIEMKTFTIRTSDYVEAQISITDIEVEEATAIFPSQEVVRNTDVVMLQGVNDAIIDELLVDEGSVRITVYSTIEEKMFMTYEIPSATFNGAAFTVTEEIPAAPPGGQTVIDKSYSFDGFKFLMTNNQFDNTVVGRIESSGMLRTITKEDSLYANIQIEKLKPSCVKGYLGQQNIPIGPNSSSLDILDQQIFTSLKYDESIINLRLENQIGMSANLDVSQLTASNTDDATSASLSPTPPTLLVNRAPNNKKAATTVLTLDNTNYNTSALINLLPNLVTYELDLNTNPNGNQGNIDFAYKGKGLDAYLDVEVPLAIQVDNLELQDSVEFNVGNASIPAEVGNGELRFIFDNSFPLEGDVTLYFLNRIDKPIDSLKFYQIEAGKVNSTTQRVMAPTKTRYVRAFSPEKIEKLLRAETMYVHATFSTKPSGSYLKIYEDYTLEVKIVGDFIYHANKPLD